jgi:hypothetical protein
MEGWFASMQQKVAAALEWKNPFQMNFVAAQKVRTNSLS